MNWNETEERPVWPEELEEPVAKLGAPSQVFATSRRKAFNKFLLGLAMFFGGLGINYLYFWVLGLGFFPDKFLLLLLFGTPVVGIGLLINSFRDRGMWVLVYPTGLLRWHRGEVVSFPWDEIESLNLHRINHCDDLQIKLDESGEVESASLNLEGAGSRFLGSYVVLHRNDGAEAYFPSSLEGYAELATTIQKETFARLWPPLWQDYRDGKSIEFGDLMINWAGLSKGTDRLPWFVFGGAKIVNGRLLISRSGKWRAWHEEAIQTVENPHLLLAMLRAAQPLGGSIAREATPPEKPDDET